MAKLPRRRRKQVREPVVSYIPPQTATAVATTPVTAAGLIAAGEEITAGATRHDLQKDVGAPRQRVRKEWEEEAWRLYRTVGEITKFGDFYGNAMAAITFEVTDVDGNQLVDVADRPEDFDLPQAALTQAQIDDARTVFGNLVGQDGTQSSLTRPLGQILSLVGDAEVVGYPVNDDGSPFLDDASTATLARFDTPALPQSDEDGTRERFVAVPANNANHKEKTVRLRRDGKPTQVHRDAMFLRIFVEDPEFPDEAFSPICAVIDCADDITIMSRTQSNSALSRAHAGMWVYPEEALPQLPAGVTGQKPGEFVHPVLQKIAAGWIDAVSDPSAPDIIVPGLLSMKSKYIESLVHKHPERLVDPATSAAIDARILRLARTLPIPPEVILGIQESAAFNAWKVTEDTYNHYLLPMATRIGDGFTDGYLWPSLASRSGWTPELLGILRVTANNTALVARVDMGEAANDAHDRLTISDEAYRAKKGFTDADAPSPEEIEERRLNQLARRGNNSARARFGPASGGVESSTMAALSDIIASGLPAGVDDDIAALLCIDRDFRAALEQAIESAIDRTVDRRGAQLRTLARKDKQHPETRAAIDQVGNDAAARVLGRDTTDRLFSMAARDIDDFAEFTAILKSRFDKLVATVRRRIDAAWQRMFDRPMTDTEAARFATRAQSAWAGLLDDMRTAVDARLFGIGPAEGEVGAVSQEATSAARRAAAELGGQPVRGVPVGEPGGGLPTVSGPALGPDGLEALEDRGMVHEDDGYLWVYGDPASRTAPFGPHLGLDSATTGVVYRGYDDDRLRIVGSFPSGTHYRSNDHKGCGCDFVPVLARRVVDA